MTTRTSPFHLGSVDRRRCLCVFVLVLCPRLVSAQGATPTPSPTVETTHGIVPNVIAARLTGPVAIDGRLTEESWLSIPAHAGFAQREPNEGEPATEETELRVAYDEDALYVGVRLFDTEPTRIMRRLSRRDESADADLVTIYLDPYHDHVSGVMFEVSAAGVQRDAQIYDDYNRDPQWDAVWVSAVAIDDQGWTAELKIPFSQLRFVSGPSQTWGINVSRFIHRKAERDWLEVVPRSAPFLASRMAHLTGLVGIEPRSRVEFLPYGIARGDVTPAVAGDPFRTGRDAFAGAGLDVKWGLTSNVTLDTTINPDFGQVEVDPSVVNLTEFESFFEEKRPFFLEGFQTFQTPASDAAFYSRRIGRAPRGEAEGEFVEIPNSSTILTAGKLTGRTANGWSLGILHAVTSRERAKILTEDRLGKVDVEPTTNYFVARVLKEGERGGLGSLMTATNRSLRSDSLRHILSRQAYVAAADGYLYLDASKDWIVKGETAFSWLEGDAAAVLEQQTSSRRYYQRPDATYVELDRTTTSLGGWRSNLSAARQSGRWKANVDLGAISPGFESNDLGFQTRADRFSTQAEISLGHFETDRWTREREIQVSKSYAWNFGGQKQVDTWELSGSATLLNYWQIEGSIGLARRTLDDHLTRGGPLAAAPRSYEVDLELESDDRKAVTVSARWSHDRDERKGWRDEGGVEMRIKPTARLEISAEPYLSRARDVAQYVGRFDDPFAIDTFGARYVFGEIDLTEASMITKLNFTLSPTLTCQFYAQPFFARGRYSAFKELARPGAFEFYRFGIESGTISLDPFAGEYEVDPDGAGPAAPFHFDNQDFNEKSLVAKAVLRWEWRLGSTLYFVWTQARSEETRMGDFDLSRDVGALFRAPADNVFLVKMSYWLSR